MSSSVNLGFIKLSFVCLHEEKNGEMLTFYAGLKNYIYKHTNKTIPYNLKFCSDENQ